MSGFEFTDRAQHSLGQSFQQAQDYAHAHLAPLHIALALLNDDTNNSTGAQSTNKESQSLFKSICEKCGVDPRKLQEKLRAALNKIPQQSPAPDDVTLSGATNKVLKQAQNLKSQQRDSFIAQDHLLLALLEDPTIASILKECGLANPELMRNAINQARGGRHIDSKTAEAGYDAIGKYCTNLTEIAAEAKLDPVIGRDDEIRRVVRVLSRRTKNNAVLIGSPGVGKTAVVEGLAQRVVNRDVPPNLLGKIFALDMGSLMAGAKYKGEYEERVKAVLNDIEKMTNDGTPCILFIDEMHLMMAGQGSDNGMDAANLLKPMLARGKLRCIGATTLNEYRQSIEKDAALERRFQQILVEEPTVEDTIAILRGIREKYEVHHGVRIMDAAIVAASQLAKRYLTSRKLPDAAIDLVDEACADVTVSRETVPEPIDTLERRKLRLEIAMHALEREKDPQSKERLAETRKDLQSLEEELLPLKADFEAQKAKGDEVNNVRRKIDELRSKAQDAERRYDLATASDLTYYAIPDLEKRLEHLLEQERKDEEEGRTNAANSVTSENIASIVSRWTGIPVSRMLESERQKLLKLEKILDREVIGQEDAVKAVAQAIRLSRSGLSNQLRPIASFLFCGPSGTGKTLMSKTLATYMFDDPDAMVRIDASEYSEKHSISRLVGAPPGYVGHDQGGVLTEAVRRRPFSIVLIDEIEKAAREFVQLFLQVLDEGRLQDSQGRQVSFRNTIIIMTSNLGSAFINDSSEDDINAETRQLVQGAIAAHFPPEFINRIDSTVIFRKLSRSNVRHIVDVRLKELQKRINDNGRKARLDVTGPAKDWLGSIGYSPTMGARPLTRAIQEQLLHPLSILLLRGEIRNEDAEIRVTFDKDRNGLLVHANHEPIVAADAMDADDVDMEEDGLDPLD
ncbi:hypothetical protein MVES1_002759 [Malassezia vespertilionis]|uniref:Hsp104p n=1 Tax=Malassezia vespertilionis TaxID=2020962 RepID=A0A2N1JAP4_9BASI|nr:uncharacterized protein MVES1_002759 [Malassezia vespertilionis]PKI83621.1 Hsp104p [Malassezia vespertilionis]WFD07395.1 hypothetical protein MVES1_002759 [Malassezia vespertilionis]